MVRARPRPCQNSAKFSDRPRGAKISIISSSLDGLRARKANEIGLCENVPGFSHGCAGRPARSRRCKVLYDEGVANHIGPKPCAGVREDVGEASAGERPQPLSRDRKLIPGADAVCVAEGDMFRRASASVWTAPRGRRTWHARTLLVREPGDLLVGHRPLGQMVRGTVAREKDSARSQSGHRLRCRSEIVPLRERRNQFYQVDGEDKPLIRVGTAACGAPLLQGRLIENSEADPFLSRAMM